MKALSPEELDEIEAHPRGDDETKRRQLALVAEVRLFRAAGAHLEDGFGNHSLNLVRPLLEKEGDPRAFDRWREQIPFSSRVAWLMKLGASQEEIRQLYQSWETWKT